MFLLRGDELVEMIDTPAELRNPGQIIEGAYLGCAGSIAGDSARS
jgi:hypothetical protein